MFAYPEENSERFVNAFIPVLRADLTPCDDLYPHYTLKTLLNPAERAITGIFCEFRELDY